MLSPFSPDCVIPITSMKNRALLSKVGVSSSRCPRWAMSKIGSLLGRSAMLRSLAPAQREFQHAGEPVRLERHGRAAAKLRRKAFADQGRAEAGLQRLF